MCRRRGFATWPEERLVEPAADAFVDRDVESQEGSGQLLECGVEDGRGDPGSGQQPGEGEALSGDLSSAAGPRRPQAESDFGRSAARGRWRPSSALAPRRPAAWPVRRPASHQRAGSGNMPMP
jgi:hypothetical protein